MKLFTVGPVEMYPDTLEESARQVPYFRTGAFSQVLLHTEKMLLELAHAPAASRVVFLTASGTGAMEAAIINCLNSQDRVITIDGGSFGHRFAQMCERHGIPQEVLQIPFGEILTEQMLNDIYCDDMTALLVNLHETSTGQLYDLETISRFCKNHKLFLIVDAISAFIADPIDMKQAGIDVMITSSQKALSLAPGISVVILSPRAVDAVQKRGTNMMYFDFRDYLKNGIRGQTPFTPAVGIILTMEKRLEYIAAAGIEKIQNSIAALARDFREQAVRIPIQIPAYPHSNALTPLYFPNGNAKSIYDSLQQKYEIMVTPNGGALADCLLRVGHMGNLTFEDNARLIRAMCKILE